jgi:hypothetical protein
MPGLRAGALLTAQPVKVNNAGASSAHRPTAASQSQECDTAAEQQHSLL